MTQTQQINEPKDTALISLDMTVGDIITKYPNTIEILTKHGVHCVGCGAKNFETLGQGLMGHGFSDEHINEMLIELNNSVTALKTDVPLDVTDKAVEKLKELLANNDKQGYGLRVVVQAGGCAGFSYGFDYENTSQDGDVVIEKDGVKFYCDKSSYEHLKGSRIDYVDSLQGAGFRISNPNATSHCGCGKSFS